jgi:hypothetical protein
VPELLGEERSQYCIVGRENQRNNTCRDVSALGPTGLLAISIHAFPRARQEAVWLDQAWISLLQRSMRTVSPALRRFVVLVKVFWAAGMR